MVVVGLMAMFSLLGIIAGMMIGYWLSQPEDEGEDREH